MYITNTTKPFDKELMDSAIKWVQKSWPNEGCGAIIKGKFVGFENKSANIKNEFLIDDDMFRHAYTCGDVECVIHSHNDFPHTSKQDQIQQIELEVPFGIINLKNKSVTHFVFWGDSIKIEPLMKRPFFFGVWDCFMSLRDIVYKNHKVLTPSPLRELDFVAHDHSYVEDLMNSPTELFPYNFIDVKDTKPGDLLLYNMISPRQIDHVGIILKGGRILHHFYNKLSASYPSSYYQKNISAAGRYDINWRGEHD